MIGGLFKRHPAFQSFEIKVIDKNHPSTVMLPEIWKKEDECYFMTTNGTAFLDQQIYYTVRRLKFL